MAADKPVVIFVLGGPGAGKGTQCAKIVEVSSHSQLLINPTSDYRIVEVSSHSQLLINPTSDYRIVEVSSHSQFQGYM